MYVYWFFDTQFDIISNMHANQDCITLLYIVIKSTQRIALKHLELDKRHLNCFDYINSLKEFDTKTNWT